MMNYEEMVHGAMWFTRAGLAYQLALAGVGRALITAGQWVLRRQGRRCCRCGADPGWKSRVTREGLICDICEGYRA